MEASKPQRALPYNKSSDFPRCRILGSGLTVGHVTFEGVTVRREGEKLCPGLYEP